MGSVGDRPHTTESCWDGFFLLTPAAFSHWAPALAVLGPNCHCARVRSQPSLTSELEASTRLPECSSPLCFQHRILPLIHFLREGLM